MDAKISIDRSINRLNEFVAHHEEAKNNPLIKHPKLKEQVQKVTKIFHAAKPFLKDVDHDFEKTLLSGGLVNDPTNTVPLLRAIYSAEDAADTFVLSKDSELIQEEEMSLSSYRGDECFTCFRYCLCCCGCCHSIGEICDYTTGLAKRLFRRFLFIQELQSSYSSNVFNRKMRKLNNEIKRLEETKGARTISDIGNNNNTRLLSFQNDRDRLSRRQRWERISDLRLEEETQVVGLQHHINDLVLRLIPQLNQRRCDDDLSAQVIAVVGEGGSGKTTLARTVYNRVEMKRHFNKRAWVCIPSGHAFNARRVLADILKQVNPAGLLVDSALTEDALMRRLIELLFGTRFLIVLDDVNQPHIWESLRFPLFPFSRSRGGRVIITTRNAENLTMDVASSLNMGQLNDEESWKLFLNEVQKTEDELNNPNPMEIKEKILNICAGLPSTIVLLGGLLSTKDEWSRILNRLADHEGIMSSSYEDLPLEVKPCFLYMGLFPRGFEVPVRRLIHLWCAEGFAISTETNPEILAEMYLEELVIRNMVQVSWRVDGTPKTSCVPSVVYDFFSSKAENVGFLDHHFWSNRRSPKQRQFTVRRLAAYIDVIDYSQFSHHHAGHLQSYIAFDAWAPITPDGVTQVFRNKIVCNRKFGLLKVLDLEGVFKPKLHYLLWEECPLLRYLGLRSTFLDSLSDVQGLKDIESLDLKHTNVNLPPLGAFKKLQHVFLNRNRIEGLPSSTTLRTLWGLYLSDSDYNINRMRSMEKLTKLGLTCTSFQISKNIAGYISQLTELQSLKLRSIDKGRASTIKLQRMDKLRKLESLYLLGNLPQSVMDVGLFPPNLSKLTLSLSGLKKDPMRVLGQLPHLNILRLLSNSYTGTSMTCTSAERFPKLRLLKLWNLPLIKEWIVEKGAMPCLGELEIRSCENLEMPRGLQHVTTLKEIVLTNMPTTFGAAVEESLKDRDAFIRSNTCNSIPFPKSN